LTEQAGCQRRRHANVDGVSQSVKGRVSIGWQPVLVRKT
jgi:hypothetical protein